MATNANESSSNIDIHSNLPPPRQGYQNSNPSKENNNAFQHSKMNDKKNEYKDDEL